MVRLFRQQGTKDWPSAIDQVLDALGEVLGLDLAQLPEVDR